MEKTELIACCGLYCANCGKYRKEKCPGCLKNDKASWCKIRRCCIEKGISNCSQCEEYIYPKDCSKYNNFISGVIEFFTASDRSLCIGYLRKNPAGKFIDMMDENGLVSLPKRKDQDS
jgi:hypothetical protein